jgi:hypothetical protein
VPKIVPKIFFHRADFPNFSVVDGSRLLPKVHGISLKKFSIKFEGCEDYLFVIAGID